MAARWMIGLAVLFAGCASDHMPITRSEARIRQVFLQAYPPGMSLEEFRHVMAKERVRILQVWSRAGGDSMPVESGLIGDTVLWVDLGMYQSLTHQVYVSAFVGFDRGRLADCAISKSPEPP